ncbi:MAG: SOS response-associated peptidase [Alphaproteobacteria bacterium]|jgi:putative SOS response-associated peptidase YedK
MCGRYVFTSPAEAMLRLFGLEVPSASPSRFNVAPAQDAWIARAGANGLEATQAKWGLVPGWSKDPSIGFKTMNARSETAAEKPTFREALQRRRCLIPADAFYEWHGTRTSKQPYLLYAEDRSPLVFAGLWERWERGDAPLETFSVLTTAADEAISWLHTRMPVALPEAAREEWVLGNAQAAADLLQRPASVPWTWHTVSPAVNAVKNDSPALLEHWEEPQGSLL